MKELITHLQEVKDFKLSMVLLIVLIMLTKFSWNHYQKLLEDYRQKEEYEKKALREMLDKVYGMMNESLQTKLQVKLSVDQLREYIKDFREEMKSK